MEIHVVFILGVPRAFIEIGRSWRIKSKYLTSGRI